MVRDGQEWGRPHAHGRDRREAMRRRMRRPRSALARGEASVDEGADPSDGLVGVRQRWREEVPDVPQLLLDLDRDIHPSGGGSPLRVKSVHGESRTKARGRASPRFAMRSAAETVRLPPAESPAMTICSARIPLASKAA